MSKDVLHFKQLLSINFKFVHIFLNLRMRQIPFKQNINFNIKIYTLQCYTQLYDYQQRIQICYILKGNQKSMLCDWVNLPAK